MILIAVGETHGYGIYKKPFGPEGAGQWMGPWDTDYFYATPSGLKRYFYALLSVGFTHGY
jgi:hypothetical protein